MLHFGICQKDRQQTVNKLIGSKQAEVFLKRLTRIINSHSSKAKIPFLDKTK